ncbi:MAG: tetratricopeptide repeat protein [Opitutaceae bacterium]
MDKNLTNQQLFPSRPRLGRGLLALLILIGLGSTALRAQQETPPVEKKKKEFKSFSNTNIDLDGMQPELRSPDSDVGEIQWSPATGYYTVGGTLGGLQPEYAQEALDLMNRARANEERGADRSALGDYKRVFKDYPASHYAPEARFRTANIYMERGRYDKAFEELDIILRGYPSYGKFNLLLGQQYEIASTYVNGYRKKIFGFIPGWTNQDRGIQYFERLVFNAPYSDYAPLSLMNVATAHLKGKDYAYAIDALDRLINAYPNSMVTGDAYLRLAQTHSGMVDGPLYDQGATREAISYFEDYLILYPKGTSLAEAEEGLGEMKEVLSQSKFKMAEFYYKKRRNYPAAKVFYNEAITVAPNSQTAATSRARLEELDSKEKALRQKQAEWLEKQIAKIDEAASKDPSRPTPNADPTTASISSPPDSNTGTPPPQASPAPPPPETRPASEGAPATETAKPKKKFLGIF